MMWSKLSNEMFITFSFHNGNIIQIQLNSHFGLKKKSAYNYVEFSCENKMIESTPTKKVIDQHNLFFYLGLCKSSV